jgi:hypothetical protein
MRGHHTTYRRARQPPHAVCRAESRPTPRRARGSPARRRRGGLHPSPTPLMGVNCAHELFPGATSQLGPTSTSGSGLRGPLQSPICEHEVHRAARSLTAMTRTDIGA